MNEFYACWWKLRKAKTYLNNFSLEVVKNGMAIYYMRL